MPNQRPSPGTAHSAPERFHRRTEPVTEQPRNAYSAADIKILGARQVEERFTWAQAQALAQRYKTVTPEHILRLMTACDISGWDKDLAERKYLQGEDGIRAPLEMIEAFAELSDQRFSP